jgi:hypothetical protein
MQARGAEDYTRDGVAYTAGRPGPVEVGAVAVGGCCDCCGVAAEVADSA